MLIKTTLIFSIVACSQALASQPCNFDVAESSYVGSNIEQARCLLRPVGRFATTLGKLRPLPKSMEQRLGAQTVEFTKAAFTHYLQSQGISPADIGGSLDEPLSPKTQYFIIHDTSSPNFGAEAFPDDINNATWSGNRLKSAKANAHVYVNRVGESTTKVNLATHQHTTKFEQKDVERRRNLFVGIELIQPRRAYPPGSNRNNDALAPAPGFTSSQLQRLAVIYLAASSRSGHYLIPAFHAVVDIKIPNGHDDPQNFDLQAWSDSIDKVIDEVHKSSNP